MQYNQHHDSLSALIRWIDETPRTWKQHSSKTDRPSRSWDLELGYEGALKLAYDGWIEGASRMAQALATLPAMDSVTRYSYGVAGGALSVGRYFSGNPMCMRNRKRDHGHRPAITMAVNIVANCTVSAEAMSNYGLAISRYADELEQAGYPVEVVAVCSAKQDRNRTSHSWTVKKQGQAMNLADIAFSIGHPGCFRRIGFAAFERTGIEVSGYGQASDITADDLPPRYSDAILLNGIKSADYHSSTPEAAITALRETIGAILDKREAQYH